MKIGIAGPLDVSLLADLFPPQSQIPKTYSFALTSSLAREFHRRGHEVSVFALSSEVKATCRIEGEGIRAYICPLRRARSQMMDFFRGERQALCDAMRESGCDVIHAHWTYEFAAAAIESGLPHVVTAHDAPNVVLRFARNAYWFAKPWLGVPVLRKARCVTAVSPYLAEELEKFLRPQKDIVVVPNGVGSEVFTLASRRDARKPQRKTIFASVLNGWDRRKNARALIKAFGTVRNQLADGVELWMFGSGFEAGGLAETWAGKHAGNSGIRFVGPVPHQELLRKLADEVDVLVHPSREETFCMAALEAMAIGLPVIGGRNSGAIPWLLDGGNLGELVDVNSAQDLAEAMMKFTRDRSAAMERTPRARTAARERYSIASVVDTYESLCQSQLR